MPPHQREAFLDRACAGDVSLRREAKSLLDAHDSAPQAFLEPEGSFVFDDRIPGLEVMRCLGRGGMGEVWLAATPGSQRPVAVKLIKLGMDTRDVLRRFQIEQRTLALMDHECIATVYTAGITERGRPYFSMEFVDGEPIVSYCDSRSLPIRARLELFLRVCNAVQHAHQRGVIHRDLKPSNILIRESEHQPVPKIIDFGIAKAVELQLGTRSLHTRTGIVLGTPEYMSPEQFDTSSSDIDSRTDVYSLGVVLYELLAGCRPVDYPPSLGLDLEKLRLRVKQHPPSAPGKCVERSGSAAASSAARGMDIPSLVRTLKGPLGQIVLRALEKDRARRYQTAAAFAEDVRRYLRGEAVSPKPGLALSPTWGLVVAVLGVAAAVGLGAWHTGLYWRRDPRTRLKVMIVTDGYVVPHVSDVVLAFRHTGATVKVAQDELINGTPMSVSLATGYDVVVVITGVGTVDGGPIDAADVDVLETAMRTRASRAFILVTDACSLCSIASSRELLSAFNRITGWSTDLGPIYKKRFDAGLQKTGAYRDFFGAWPSIRGNNFSPLMSVPEANVIYRTGAGVLSAVAPAGNAACVFITTDSTPFVAPVNGTPEGQADGLAAAYLEAAVSAAGPCTQSAASSSARSH